MKLIFSEHNPDYTHYQFSYCVWAMPETGDTIESIFNSGFLPSGSNPIRYYLSRSLRISCSGFKLSSENKRILRKNTDISIYLISRDNINLDESLIAMCLQSANARFGHGVMSRERLLSLLSSPHTTHFLAFHIKDELIGIVTCLNSHGNILHYNFAFYRQEREYELHNMAIFMMTKAIKYLKEMNYKYIYLGTAYTTKAKYKTQFSGAEFFNGRFWCKNLDELKYLMERDNEKRTHHLLEDEDYINRFLFGTLNNLEIII